MENFKVKFHTIKLKKKKDFNKWSQITYIWQSSVRIKILFVRILYEKGDEFLGVQA